MASAMAGAQLDGVWRRQMRTGLMRMLRWLQPMKALSEAMRCTRPFSKRKSSARYTVGGAARRPSCSLSTARIVGAAACGSARQLQHALAQRGQAHALARAEAVGFGQRVADAVVVVMGRAGQRVLDMGGDVLGRDVIMYQFNPSSDARESSFLPPVAGGAARRCHLRPGRSARSDQHQALAADCRGGAGRRRHAGCAAAGQRLGTTIRCARPTRRLRDAELFYWIGPDLESFLPRRSALEGTTVAVQDLPKLTLRRFGDAHTCRGRSSRSRPRPRTTTTTRRA